MNSRNSTFRAVLAKRDYRRLAGGLAISQAGDWLYNVAIVVYVFEATHSPTWIAATTIMRLAPYVLFGAIGGSIADRFERRKVMIACDLGRACVMGGLAILAATHGPALGAIVLAFASTTLGTPYNPSVGAMTPDLVGEELLAPANALNSAIQHVAIIAGPAVGAILLALGTPVLAFVLNAVSFVAGSALVSTIRTRSVPAAAASGEKLQTTRERIVQGFGALSGSTTATILVAFVFVTSFVYGTDTVLFVLVSRQLGTGVEGVGYLLAALGLGGLLAAWFTNRLAAQPRLGTILVAGLVVYCVPTFANVFVHRPAIGFGIQVVRGAGNIVVDVLAITALQRSLANDVLGRVFGIVDSIAVGGMLLGAFASPIVVHAFGLHGALAVWAFAYPALALVTLPRLAAQDRDAQKQYRLLAPRIAMLERAGIFTGAPRQALEAMAASISEYRVPAGVTVIRQGDPADHFYVIAEGNVEVLAAAEDRGLQVTVAKLGPGDYFGEIGLLRGIPRTADVRTTEDTVLYRITGSDFLETLNASPSSAPSVTEGAAMRLARTHAATAKPVAISLEPDGVPEQTSGDAVSPPGTPASRSRRRS